MIKDYYWGKYSLCPPEINSDEVPKIVQNIYLLFCYEQSTQENPKSIIEQKKPHFSNGTKTKDDPISISKPLAFSPTTTNRLKPLFITNSTL